MSEDDVRLHPLPPSEAPLEREMEAISVAAGALVMNRYVFESRRVHSSAANNLDIEVTLRQKLCLGTFRIRLSSELL